MIALRPVLVPYTSQTLLTSHGKPTLMMKHSNEMYEKKLVYKNRRVGILLDYAARDEDESKVLQCYDKIVLALNEILSEL
ncbi:uncharacterized protein [Gossypium hirsutum]|uniref:Uncharacterized protein isoform X2 n=1 Tax=Gossypium hirsutum TaxID=3635 RepID=A0ABM3AES0_GOSHI|nr:uncharacterized protein LOC121219361 isoform X2 [Gossypium hirsutum]